MPENALPHRSVLGRAVVAALGTVLVAALLAAPPAGSAVVLPVDCSASKEDPTVIRWDDLSYELEGECFTVVVTADRARVTMSSATRLVVEGEANTVDALAVGTAVVRGADHRVSASSVQTLRVAARGSHVAVAGLVEDARITGAAVGLSADRAHRLVVRGDRATLHVRRGYLARLRSDRSRATFRRLGELAVRGHRNRVVVERGRTELRVRGVRNRVRARPVTR